MASLPTLGVRVAVRRCADGSELPIIAAPGGKLYVISEEGTEFDVLCEMGPSFPVAFVPGNCYGAELKIDSADVGYWKTNLKPNSSIIFEGYCEQASEYGASQYRRFRFAKADATRDGGPEVTDPEQITTGRITVSFSENQATGTRAGPPAIGSGAGGGPVGQLPEGKKFFLAPSLKTGKGAADFKQTTWSSTTYSRLAYVGTVELRYETASTLMLRGVLNKSNATHRALLRSSRDPGIRALIGDSDDEDEGQGTSRPRGGIKPDPDGAGGGGVRVKRERGGGGGSVYMDLTRPVDAPIRVGGRELGADEVAVCDLVSSDDEEGGGGGGGRWEVRKKQAVEVEGGGEEGEEA